MKGIRCRECGFLNPDKVRSCRRCGWDKLEPLVPKSKVVSPREQAKQSTWLYTLLIIALIVGGAYYLLSGIEKSYDQVQPAIPNRSAVPRNQQNAPALTRSESDQKRVTPFKNAVQNAPSLVESNRHVAETQKLMDSAK
jgi:ribosomal protein L40E